MCLRISHLPVHHLHAYLHSSTAEAAGFHRGRCCSGIGADYFILHFAHPYSNSGHELLCADGEIMSQSALGKASHPHPLCGTSPRGKDGEDGTGMSLPVLLPPMWYRVASITGRECVPPQPGGPSRMGLAGVALQHVLTCVSSNGLVAAFLSYRSSRDLCWLQTY
jgi:hypothetical protein